MIGQINVVNLLLLYLPYQRGGLQLPNLEWYYRAAQIRAGMFILREITFQPGFQ